MLTRLLVFSAALGALPAPLRVSLEARVPATSHAALAAGLTAWQNAVRSGAVRRTDVLTVIDYSRPSTEPRLFVLDVASGRVRYAERVAHGRGSGENATERFSNRDGSRMTSLGVFRAGETLPGPARRVAAPGRARARLQRPRPRARDRACTAPAT